MKLFQTKMVATKKTVTRYGRRRYYRYRRYRSVSNQYFRIRVEGVYTIAFPSAQVGEPVFAENNGLRVVTFNTLFSQSQYYGSLVSMFGYFKVTGVLMEITPGSNNFKDNNQIGLNVLLGFRFGKISVMTFKELVADDNSIVLGINSNKRKYASTLGSNGWTSTDDPNNELGAFSVGSSLQSDMARSPSWTCRLAVYMIFKKSNI